MCCVVPVLGLSRTFRTTVFLVSWLSMPNTWVSPFPTDVSCSLPHLQRGSLVAALCVSAGVTRCGWLFPAHMCFLRKLRSVRDAGRHEWQGEQEDWVLGWQLQNKTLDASDRQGREINISRTWFLLSLCTCKKKTWQKKGKNPPFDCLFISWLQRELSCLTERRDVKSLEIRGYQSHHSYRNQGNFTQGLDIWHLYVDTIMCGDTCMCNIIPGCMRNFYLQDAINTPIKALPSQGHLVLKPV